MAQRKYENSRATFWWWHCTSKLMSNVCVKLCRQLVHSGRSWSLKSWFYVCPISTKLTGIHSKGSYELREFPEWIHTNKSQDSILPNGPRMFIIRNGPRGRSFAAKSQVLFTAYQVTLHWTGMGDPYLGIGPFPEVVGVVRSQDLQLRVRSASVDCTANLSSHFIYLCGFLIIQDFKYPQLKYS